MNRTQREISRMRKEMRAARRDIDRLAAAMERNNRIDDLIDDMKRTAREMLRLSREL